MEHVQLIVIRPHLLKYLLKKHASKELTDFDRKYIDEYKKIMPLEQQGMAIKEHAKIPFQDDVKDWVSHIIQDQIKVAKEKEMIFLLLLLPLYNH